MNCMFFLTQGQLLSFLCMAEDVHKRVQVCTDGKHLYWFCFCIKGTYTGFYVTAMFLRKHASLTFAQYFLGFGMHGFTKLCLGVRNEILIYFWQWTYWSQEIIVLLEQHSYEKNYVCCILFLFPLSEP